MHKYYMSMDNIIDVFDPECAVGRPARQDSPPSSSHTPPGTVSRIRTDLIHQPVCQAEVET